MISQSDGIAAVLIAKVTFEKFFPNSVNTLEILLCRKKNSLIQTCPFYIEGNNYCLRRHGIPTGVYLRWLKQHGWWIAWWIIQRAPSQRTAHRPPVAPMDFLTYNLLEFSKWHSIAYKSGKPTFGAISEIAKQRAISSNSIRVFESSTCSSLANRRNSFVYFCRFVFEFSTPRNFGLKPSFHEQYKVHTMKWLV